MLKQISLQKRIKKKDGFTMVELIVTFALLGLLMVAASYVVSSGLSIYYRVKTTNSAELVSDTLMDKISGELASARVGTDVDSTMIIANDLEDGADPVGSSIFFYNEEGNPVVISAVDGRLLVHYRPVYNVDDGTYSSPTDWTFDDAVYMFYDITELSFSDYIKDGKKTNILEISLTVKNVKTGYEYHQDRYVECYNFSKNTDVEKIGTGEIPAE